MDCGPERVVRVYDFSILGSFFKKGHTTDGYGDNLPA